MARQLTKQLKPKNGQNKKGLNTWRVSKPTIGQ
jgi:hypothetical protein